MYGVLLPHVRHRADLNYLIDQIGGEIAVGTPSSSAATARPSSPPVGPLGADFAVENGRYGSREIYTGESWNPDLRAPLAAPGADVKRGRLPPGGERRRAPAPDEHPAGCSTAPPTGRPS